MKLVFWILFIGLLIGLASTAAIPDEEYLPPDVKKEPIDDTPALANDGYRYKTVKKLCHRRDVSELVAPESAMIDDDGYHYRNPKPVAPLEMVSNEYLPPSEEASEIKEASETPDLSIEYLPPANELIEKKETRAITEAPTNSEATVISEEPVVPEVPEVPETAEVSNQYFPPADNSEIVERSPKTAVLADDGYHYRRFIYRRDVSEIAAPKNGYLYEAPAATEKVFNLYLPPVEAKEADIEAFFEEPQVSNEYLPPVVEVEEAPEVDKIPDSKLAEDGYRYKTIRKLKYRHRRDVSEIVAPKHGYLYEAPAATEEVSNTYLFPAEVKEADTEPFSEEQQVSNEYLSPVSEVKEAPEVDEVLTETSKLAEDGYRYENIRKLKYRHRRDVSELVAPEESAILADDGYHYKIPEASEAFPKISNEYLPPANEIAATKETPEVSETSEKSEGIKSFVELVSTEAPTTTEAAPIVTETPTTTEAPKVANEYLPPAKDIPELKEASEVPEETAVLADDGYHYKVGKRFRFRRDVSEIIAPSKGYLYEPPVATNEASNIYLPPAEIKEAEEPTEISQVSNEYLPPAEQSNDDADIVEAPKEVAALAEDGYRYKTIRRLKYRHRRDVSEIVAPQNGYLYRSPIREAIDIPVETPIKGPVDSTILVGDGYRYKTVRRIRYRHRRDVSELIAPVEESAVIAQGIYHYKNSEGIKDIVNEYLPPVDAVAEVKEVPEVAEAGKVVEAAIPTEPPQILQISSEYLSPAVAAPEESAALANDGYHYKTVRQIRYRHRRDVSEIADSSANGYVYQAPEASESVDNEPVTIEPTVSEPVTSDPTFNEYLPPVAEIKEATVPPQPIEAIPDVSNEYLPPADETQDDATVVDAPQESAVLADDGYRYKTVRRIRYRRNVSEPGYLSNAPVKAEPEVNYFPPAEVAKIKDAASSL